MKHQLICTALLAAMTMPVQADWGEDCEYSRDIEATLDVSGSELLAVVARAGTLVINGESDRSEVEIHARVCASEKDWLEESSVETREAKTARIEVEIPDFDGGWSLWGGNRYVRVDLELVVPENLALDIKDSSGSMKLHGAGAATIIDSSGSIAVEDSNGTVSVRDSSGSVRFARINGDVIIESDSSGSISGKDIRGSVLVKKDSSGGISFTDVAGDFTVERDSSGSISANGVGGDFVVLKDGSGGISSRGVKGEVRTPLD
ncbi:MAG: hypothetical protein HKN15_10875 [Xanthomonadales bacterium]|nr:hypothetical protein [Xanthomonadales bacterium]